MQTNEIAAIGYAIAMTVFAILTALLLSRWKNSPKSQLMAVGSGAAVVWGAVLGLQSLGYLESRLFTVLVEWLRYAAWLVALLAVLREIDPSRLAERVASRYGIIILVIAALPFIWYLAHSADDPIPLVAIVGVGYLMCVLILSAVEQVYRNAPVDSRSGLNYFCVAVAGIFAFDLIPFVLVMAGASTEREYWAARGFVSGMFAVPLSVGIWRTFRLSFDVQFPRQIVFYSFALAASGIYVVLAVMGRYYVTRYGGSWSEVAGVVFTVAVIALVAVLAVSPSTRARVRVFLMKTFFQYKYDYRKEWLRFIRTLTESGLDNVPATSIRAVAQIVNSPGGIVWVQEREGEPYLAVAAWRHAIPTVAPLDEDSSLVRFLRERQWTIDLEEMKQEPARYDNLQLEPWLEAADEWWLIVPLLLGDRLSGFILLARPRVVPALNFEDHDLLRTVGRHVATHISQAEADRRLAESRQFGTYNRLTAYLMHDLNNLVAQQSLVVKNAERFRDNPKFVDDTIETIAHSVARMKRLMEQLSSRSKEPVKRRVDLREALRQAVERSRPRRPVPELRGVGPPGFPAAVGPNGGVDSPGSTAAGEPMTAGDPPGVRASGEPGTAGGSPDVPAAGGPMTGAGFSGVRAASGPITVVADAERLTTVFEHLVRNAQDATDETGQVTVSVELEDGVAHVTIEDTGCGMTPEFVRERLFRPFDSTKGSEAMGIGAYQAREYVRALGGQLEIASEPGVGTTWSIRLPIA